MIGGKKMERGKDNLENTQMVEMDQENKKILDELFECEVVDTAFTCHEARHVK